MEVIHPVRLAICDLGFEFEQRRWTRYGQHGPDVAPFCSTLSGLIVFFDVFPGRCPGLFMFEPFRLRVGKDLTTWLFSDWAPPPPPILRNARFFALDFADEAALAAGEMDEVD